MILTLTLNPSIDYLYKIDRFHLGHQNRFQPPAKMVGGKGINAGRTASILGSDVLSTTVLAGQTGHEIKERLKNEGFHSCFFEVPGESRNAITIMHDNNIQTEIVERGPYIDFVTEQKVLQHLLLLCRLIPEIKVIVLAGSANSDNQKLYQQFVTQIYQHKAKDIKIITDISGHQLTNLLKEGPLPYLIKPNIHEFSAFIGKSLSHKEQLPPYLDSPIIKDLPLIIISCGSEGAIAKHYDQIYDLTIPKIELVNPTGSGDATVGGAAYAMDQGLPIEEVLKYAMAAGVANAMEEAVGFVQANYVAALLKEIQIIELN